MFFWTTGYSLSRSKKDPPPKKKKDWKAQWSWCMWLVSYISSNMIAYWQKRLIYSRTIFQICRSSEILFANSFKKICNLITSDSKMPMVLVCRKCCTRSNKWEFYALYSRFRKNITSQISTFIILFDGVFLL